MNRILRLLPSYGVRSQPSIRAYADIYVAFGRFLEERRGGQGMWDVTPEDFQALHQVRRVELATCQSKAPWNLWLAALDKLHRVGVDEGVIAAKTVVSPTRCGLGSLRPGCGRDGRRRCGLWGAAVPRPGLLPGAAVGRKVGPPVDPVRFTLV